MVAFVSFSLCASAIYILNDCLDLEADRRHPKKKDRPFASGELSIAAGLAMSLGCLTASFTLAALLPHTFLIVLGGYLALTTGYSLYLKSFVLVDVIVLAQLYTLRVYGGGAATGIVPSHWLLTFSLFIFLSLALMKRFTEIRLMSQTDRKDVTRSRLSNDGCRTYCQHRFVERSYRRPCARPIHQQQGGTGVVFQSRVFVVGLSRDAVLDQPGVDADLP